MLGSASLRIVHCWLLPFLLLVQFAQSQSRTHKIVCPDGSSREACDLFNEAVEDDDKELYKASKRDHMIVCFRPNSNVFLLLSYDLPRESLWQEKDGGGLQQSGNVDFLRFTNGNANFGGESLFAVGQWVSTSRGEDRMSRFQGRSLDPPVPPGAKGRVDFDNGQVEVDSSRIHVSNSYVKTFDDPRFLKTEYEFSLTASTNEFVEASRPPGSTASPIPVTGQCVTYK
jgi:hypothetical protein